MVLYDKDNTVRWASNTVQEPKEVEVKDKKGKKTTEKVPWKVDLKVQDDGNMVLYREDGQVLWSTNTAGRKGDGAESSLTVTGADGVLLKKTTSEDEEGGKQGEEERWAEDKEQDAKDAARDDAARPANDRQEGEDEEEGMGDDDEKMADESMADDAAGEALSSQLTSGPSKVDTRQEHTVIGAGHAGKRPVGGRGRYLKRPVQRAADASGSVSPIQEVIDSLV